MIQEEIIDMAKEAYGPITGQWWDMDIAALARFAELVAAREREACSKLNFRGLGFSYEQVDEITDLILGNTEE